MQEYNSKFGRICEHQGVESWQERLYLQALVYLYISEAAGVANSGREAGRRVVTEEPCVVHLSEAEVVEAWVSCPRAGSTDHISSLQELLLCGLDPSLQLCFVSVAQLSLGFAELEECGHFRPTLDMADLCRNDFSVCG